MKSAFLPKMILKKIGAVRAFIKLQKQSSSIKPSLNFLYALVGALENDHWINIAQSERGRLLIELDGYSDLEEILKKDGIELEQ
jgi:DNA transformation protein